MFWGEHNLQDLSLLTQAGQGGTSRYKAWSDKAGFQRKQLSSYSIMPLCFPNAQPTLTHLLKQDLRHHSRSPAVPAVMQWQDWPRVLKLLLPLKLHVSFEGFKAKQRIYSCNFWQSNHSLKTPPKVTRPLLTSAVTCCTQDQKYHCHPHSLPAPLQLLGSTNWQQEQLLSQPQTLNQILVWPATGSSWVLLQHISVR